jgi:hypothetical protein
MANGYYKQFDVVRIDADGVRIPLNTETLDVQNLTTSTSLGTVDTLPDGIVEESFFTSVVAGDVVEFSHAGDPNTFRLTLGSTKAQAYTLLVNAPVAFVVENLVSGENTSTDAYAYITDISQPNLPPQYVGKVAPGQNLIPYQTANPQNIRVHLVSQSDKRQLTTWDLAQAESADLAVPAAAVSPRLLFSFISDVGSTMGGADVFTDLIPENTFDGDGAVVRAYFSGLFAANAHTKYFTLSLDGAAAYFTTSTTQNGGSWHIETSIIRVAADTVRFHTAFTRSAGDGFEQWADDQVVDLLAPLLLTFSGDSDANNDYVAKFGYAERLLAAPSSPYLLGADTTDLLTGATDHDFLKGRNI